MSDEEFNQKVKAILESKKEEIEKEAKAIMDRKKTIREVNQGKSREMQVAIARTVFAEEDRLIAEGKIKDGWEDLPEEPEEEDGTTFVMFLKKPK